MPHRIAQNGGGLALGLGGIVQMNDAPGIVLLEVEQDLVAVVDELQRIRLLHDRRHTFL